MSQFDYVHCGVETVSMSKRIMHKVFDVYKDCGVNTCCQYTYSIHLTYDVDKHVKTYTQHYNKDVVGDGLGNFHVDFSMDVAVTETYGVESLLLGKPNTYIDILESTDNDGNTITSEHIRCRDIPTSCITYKASQDNITGLAIYKTLYTGKVVEFDLTNNLTKQCL